MAAPAAARLAAACALLVLLASAPGAQGRLMPGGTGINSTSAPVVVMARPVLVRQQEGANASAAAGQPRVLAALPTFEDKLKKLVEDFCYLNSGEGCEVDLELTSDWAKKHYASHAKDAVKIVTGRTPLKMSSEKTVTKSFASTFVCPYSPVSAQTCRLAGQSITSNTVTETHTSSYSFNGKVGFATKVGFMGSEVQTEVTLDFGYSFIDSVATANVDGETTVASVSVPMTPQDKRCAVISVVLQRVKQNGGLSAYAAVNHDGLVAIRQSSNKRWKFMDHEGNIRALYIGNIVPTGKRHNMASAREWTEYVEHNPTRRMYRLDTLFALGFDVAVSGYADPQMYPMDDPRCQS